jgi:hypothetical protein
MLQQDRDIKAPTVVNGDCRSTSKIRKTIDLMGKLFPSFDPN